MTYSENFNSELSNDEWNELVALKNVINQNPASVHPEKMALFTELMVRSLEGKGDSQPVDQLSTCGCKSPCR
jgi:hypothetical protein